MRDAAEGCGCRCMRWSQPEPLREREERARRLLFAARAAHLSKQRWRFFGDVIRRGRIAPGETRIDEPCSATRFGGAPSLKRFFSRAPRTKLGITRAAHPRCHRPEIAFWRGTSHVVAAARGRGEPARRGPRLRFGGRLALIIRRPALPRFGADDVPMEKPPTRSAGGGGLRVRNAKPGVERVGRGGAARAASRSDRRPAPLVLLRTPEAKTRAAGAPPPNAGERVEPRRGRGRRRRRRASRPRAAATERRHSWRTARRVRRGTGLQRRSGRWRRGAEGASPGPAASEAASVPPRAVARQRQMASPAAPPVPRQTATAPRQGGCAPNVKPELTPSARCGRGAPRRRKANGVAACRRLARAPPRPRRRANRKRRAACGRAAQRPANGEPPPRTAPKPGECKRRRAAAGAPPNCLCARGGRRRRDSRTGAAAVNGRRRRRAEGRRRQRPAPAAPRGAAAAPELKCVKPRAAGAAGARRRRSNGRRCGEERAAEAPAAAGGPPAAGRAAGAPRDGAAARRR